MLTTTTTTISAPRSLKAGKTEVGIPKPLQDGHETELDSSTSSDTTSLKGIAIITILTGVSFLNTMGSGILTIALPRLPGPLITI
jgi:hypothetical protein